MKRLYRVNKRDSLKENIKHVLPEMFNDFFIMKDDVVNFPMRKNSLHEMRKAGKPLRYMMELGEYAFGSEFSGCLAEVKKALELMGEIHDADVMIPEYIQHMTKIRIYNSSAENPDDRFSTRTLRFAIDGLRLSRKKMFAELQTLLNGWSAENFGIKLVNAMETDPGIKKTNDSTDGATASFPEPREQEPGEPEPGEQEDKTNI